MTNDFYCNLAELKEEINGSFPYKSLAELSRSANDFEKMDIARMLIEVCTEITRDSLDTVGYRPPVFRGMAKIEGLSNIAINCIHACAGSTLYNDAAIVKRILENLGYIAFQSYSSKAYISLYDAESESTADKE